MSVATFPGPEQEVVNMSRNELLCDGLRDRGCPLGSRGGVVASFHSRSGEVSGLVINGGLRLIIDTLSLTSAGIGGLSIIGSRANGGLGEGWPIVQGNGIKPRWSHLASDHSGCTYDRQLDSPYHSAAGSAAGVSRDRTAARGSRSVSGANSSPAVAGNTAAQFGSSSVSQ